MGYLAFVLVGCSIQVTGVRREVDSVPLPPPAYANETLLLSFGPQPIPAMTSSNSEGYLNETLGLSFEILSAPLGIENIPSATWTEIKPLAVSGMILLIDVRRPTDYQRGHVPSAISLPAETSDAELQIEMARYPKDQQIAVYCESIGCPVSHAFAQRLVSFGFTNVRDIPGGFAEYIKPQSP